MGSDHPDLTTLFHNLTLLYRDRGKYNQAEPFYQRALTIRETVLGLEHLGTLTSLILATLYKWLDVDDRFKLKCSISYQSTRSRIETVFVHSLSIVPPIELSM